MLTDTLPNSIYTQRAEKKQKETETQNIIDIKNFIYILFLYKDIYAQKNLKISSNILNTVISSYGIGYTLNIAEKNRTITHNEWSKRCASTLQEPEKFIKYEIKDINIDIADIDIPILPMIQTATKKNCVQSIFETPKDTEIEYTVLLLGLFVGYKSNYTCAVRTLILTPTPRIIELYTFVLELRKYIITKLYPGIRICDIRIGCEELIQNKYPKQLNKFITNMGGSIGFEQNEKMIQFTKTDVLELKESMVLCFYIGFTNLIIDDLPKNYTNTISLMIGDTVHIKDKDTIVVLTDDSPYSPSIVCHQLQKERISNTLTSSNVLNSEKTKPKYDNVNNITNDEEKQSTKIKDIKEESSTALPYTLRNQQRNAIEERQKEEEKLQEQERKKDQIMKRRTEERIQLFTTKNTDTEDGINDNTSKVSSSLSDNNNKQSNTIISYNDIKNYPINSKIEEIYVDTARESILLPIHGIHVPFHISHLRNISKTQTGDTYIIQLRFYVPDRNGQHPSNTKNLANKDDIFINEQIYRSRTPELFIWFQSIDQLRKCYLQKIKAQQMRNSIIEQEKQEQLSKPNIVLHDIMCLPLISRSKKDLGKQTTHINGLKYIVENIHRNSVDIIFTNIKTCFFQRADSSNNRVQIHFEQVHPILQDKNRQTNFLQFYRDIGEESYDVGRTTFDDDEYEMQQEEQERKQRKETNHRFKNFARMLEEQWRDKDVPLEFCIPITKLKFTGTVGRTGSVDVYPTTGNCIVALEEKIPFVVQLSDIDHITFERVTPRNRNVDIVLINKDLKTIIMISAVGKEFILPLQEWLLEAEIPYNQIESNLIWKNILEDIHTQGIQSFYLDGGWSKFQNSIQEDDDEEDNISTRDGNESEYSESEEDFDSNQSDSFSSYDDEESSEISESDLDDDDDEVVDWEELEKRAARDDRKKATEEHNRSKNKQKLHMRSK